MAINTVIDSSGLVKKSDYTPAHSILVQQSGTGVPSILQIGNNTLVGRVSGGGSEIDDLTPTQVKTMLDIQISDVADLQDELNTKQSILLPLMPYDYWYETRFINLNTLQQHLVGTAIASGTALVAPPVVASNPFPYGCYVRSSASANSGYRFASGLANNDYFGVSSHKYQEVFMYRTSLTGITRRIGYGDTTNQLDCVDGAYFETVGTTVNCKTSDNSTRTTVTMVATLSVNIPYLFDIEVNELGTLATFKLINGITGVEIESRTISTNIPTATTRGFGIMSVSTQVTAGIADIGILYYMGNGTINGFNRQRN